jgi:hypothetical protein
MVLAVPALILAAPADGLARPAAPAPAPSAPAVTVQAGAGAGVRAVPRGDLNAGRYTSMVSINCAILTEAARARMCGGETTRPKPRKKIRPAG